ncbi:peptidoglycan recognition protein 1-like [Mixophyes fleayi]|uniref:peptidoglycan recognition protein 1-like n=1 Tax=Mixophyes fleayi TaxID=3061075 RepID=UPI003F4E0559
MVNNEENESSVGGRWRMSDNLAVSSSTMIRLLVLLSVLCVAANGCINIITRTDWRAKKSECTDILTTPVKYVIIHHTEGASCDSINTCSAEVSNIQNDDMKRPREWCDIGYNFLIGEDGEVYEGRGWTTQGNYTESYNSISISIGFIGDFTDHPPNSTALFAAEHLIACGMYKRYISKCYILKGLRDVDDTTCLCEDSLYRVIQGWPHYKS